MIEIGSSIQIWFKELDINDGTGQSMYFGKVELYNHPFVKIEGKPHFINILACSYYLLSDLE